VVDFVGLMTYDLGSPHAPANAASTYLPMWAGTFNKNQLIVGVPFYGKGSASCNTAETQVYYSMFKAAAGAITAASDTWSGCNFNGVNTIASKTQYAIQNDYAGVMVWDGNQDLWIGDSLSLMRSLVHSKNIAIGNATRIPLSSWKPVSSTISSSSRVIPASSSSYVCPSTHKKVVLDPTKAKASSEYVTKGVPQVAANAFDANAATKWVPSNQIDTLAIQLTSLSKVSMFKINFASANYSAAEYKIEVSKDGIQWDSAYHEYVNTLMNASPSIPPKEANWVRFISLAGYIGTPQVTEMEVYSCGEPVVPVESSQSYGIEWNARELSLKGQGKAEIVLRDASGAIKWQASAQVQNQMQLTMPSDIKGVVFADVRFGSKMDQRRLVLP
jgi:hypothetical protein